ncbi:MAG: DUF2017 domain-containing protein [Methylacidiphilales bacterium]|nr:DUF2017 domain-containing protein [Candidatus Methylacidiphilales bacterium]MDW8349609.1 DUF2017 family protein [Verrucomicrobiae bacterium]
MELGGQKKELRLDAAQCAVAVRAGELLMELYRQREVVSTYDDGFLGRSWDEEWLEMFEDERQGEWNEERLDRLEVWLRRVRRGKDEEGAVFVLDSECVDWALRVLNDLRLSLAVKYKVTERDMSLHPLKIRGAERREAMLLIHWCAALQQALLESVQE